MIFVTEAIGTRACGFFQKMTWPVLPSIRMALREVSSGSIRAFGWVGTTMSIDAATCCACAAEATRAAAMTRAALAASCALPSCAARTELPDARAACDASPAGHQCQAAAVAAAARRSVRRASGRRERRRRRKRSTGVRVERGIGVTEV